MKQREERKISGRALRHLSSKLYGEDRRRNLTAAAAVAMSAMLVIVALSTILTASAQMRRQRQMLLGTQAEGIYFYINGMAYHALKNSECFDDVRLVSKLGTWETDVSKGSINTLYYAEEETAGWNFNVLEEGHWPSDIDEIVVDRNFVEANGGDIRVGSRIQIILKVFSGETKKEVVVTGICAANDALEENRIYVTETLGREIMEDVNTRSPEESIDAGGYYRIVYCRFEPGKYTSEELKEILEEAIGISKENINAVVTPNAGNHLAAGALVLVVCLSALVSVCAGLMVYTIYYISAVKNAARYGQLKLLGVTEGQIKKIVFWHALRQYAAGFPTGCILGVVFAYVLMPMVSAFAGLANAVPILRISYFLCAAFVSLAVVLLGAQKPMRILAEVPPIHAARIVEAGGKKVKRIQSKCFTNGGFARKNIRRRAKKTVLVATSAAVVLVVFVCTMNVVNSLNVDALMQNFNQFADITIATEDVLQYTLESSNGLRQLKENWISDNMGNDLLEIFDGMDVTFHYDLSMVGFLYGEEAEKLCNIVLGDNYREGIGESNVMVNRALEYQNKRTGILVEYQYRFYEYGQVKEFEVYEGSIDREKFESGQYVLAVAQDGAGESLYHAGDTISLYSEYPEDAETKEHWERNEDGHYVYFDALPRKNYEVLAVVGDSYRRKMYNGDAHMDASLEFIFPMQSMSEMPQKPGLFMVTMDAEDAETLEHVEPLVAKYLATKGGTDISYRSRSVYKKKLEQFGMTLTLIGDGLAALVGVMFVVSFLNSSVSSIAERREEFATLQAIGMTRRRLIQILKMENLYTVLAAVIPGYLIGQLVSFVAIHLLSSQISYFVWKADLISGILLAAVICGLVMVYPNRRTDIGTARGVVHL